jgi:hypothetical protein
LSNENSSLSAGVGSVHNRRDRLRYAPKNREKPGIFPLLSAIVASNRLPDEKRSSNLDTFAVLDSPAGSEKILKKLTAAWFGQCCWTDRVANLLIRSRPHILRQRATAGPPNCSAVPDDLHPFDSPGR